MSAEKTGRILRAKSFVLLVLAGAAAVMVAAAAMKLPELDAAAPKLYVRGGSWPQTLLASRQNYGAWWGEQLGGLKPGPWYARERIKGRGKEPGPGEPVNFAARDETGGRVWTRRLDFVDGIVHPDLGGSSEPIALLARRITAEKPARATAWLGAQRGVELWLNGRKIFSDPRLGEGLSPEADQAKVALEFEEGANLLVLKTQGQGWGGFYFSLLPREELFTDPLTTILRRMAEDFPSATDRLQRDLRRETLVSWFRYPGEVDLEPLLLRRALERLGSHNAALRAEMERAIGPDGAQDRERCLDLYAASSPFRRAWEDLDRVDLGALRRAIQDLAGTFPGRYPHGEQYLDRVGAYEKRLPQIRRSLEEGDESAIGEVAAIAEFQRQALLSNPLLDFEKLLLIKRKPYGDPRVSRAVRGLGEFLGLPQQSSFQLHRIRQPFGWENEIAVLSMSDLDGDLTALYRPPTPRLVSSIDLHFDAGRMLFSMPGLHDRWQVFEIDALGGNPRQVTLGDQPDVDSFDACYLPNGKIVVLSTAVFQGVPCNDSISVASSYLIDADGRNMRQLTFDQDHSYDPTVMNDGRILYLRWEYTDIPHIWARYLFTMNPDGTAQRAYYGSGSYWPNSTFFARPIPGHPTKVAGIITGHHIGREGELVIFDPAKGRRSTDGVVQRIPGYGKKVDPLVQDKLTEDSWPKFLHPYPLSENYFIVSSKPTPDDLWGIYLVDVFDNMVLLKEIEGHALFEPTPLRKRETPPVIPDKVNPGRTDGLVYIENIYEGPGLVGVPRGAVKELRLYTYNFAYDKAVGISNRVGTDGPWEPKRILGTVPVESDGSAFFRVPAKTPISLQPLDAEGKALQLMRSWTTAMPGEFISCTGCHDDENHAPPGRRNIAIGRKPSEIEPWHGPVRGFGFRQEVQPVLDRYCVSCHDGSAAGVAKGLPDLRADQDRYVVFKRSTPQVQTMRGVSRDELLRKNAGVFDPSYIALRRLVRVGGLESDIRLQAPGEFHADTSELIQMLHKGHHGVKLDKESWNRLTTWIDLNAPAYGTWSEAAGREKIDKNHLRRLETRRMYGGVDEDDEVLAKPSYPMNEPVHPAPIAKTDAAIPRLGGWPWDGAEAKLRQLQAGQVRRKIEIAPGVALEMVLIPAGAFVMGGPDGDSDERPMAAVTIDRPFWMGKYEITNEQFACFDPSHDSRFEHGYSWIFAEEHLGQLLNHPTQPAVRVSWKEAIAFCRWLSGKLGESVTLPSEAQWEYGCRSGTDTPFYFGGAEADFSRYANLADASVKALAYWGRHDSPDLLPRDARFDDGNHVTAGVGSYAPNVWGLHDMHGNVWEWTRSAYLPYPYREHDGRNDLARDLRRAVRGGSWYDRPGRARASFRLSYPAWQKIYNVGFRVIIETVESRPEVAGMP